MVFKETDTWEVFPMQRNPPVVVGVWCMYALCPSSCGCQCCASLRTLLFKSQLSVLTYVSSPAAHPTCQFIRKHS